MKLKETKMFTNRLFYPLIVIALIVVTACAPTIQVTETPVPLAHPFASEGTWQP
jgi:hypothetical protein